MHRATAFVASILLLTVVACGSSNPTVSPAGVTTPTTSAVSSPTATAGATATSGETASPPEASNAAALMLGSQRALTVHVPDVSGPATYATSGDTLYRDANGTWSEVGHWDPVFSLLVDPSNSDVLYSGGHPGCAVGGPALSLRKSSDGGQTWETLLTGQNVRPVIVDPRDSQVIYGERCSLAVSTNGGQSWTDYQMTPSFDVSAMALAGTQLYALITSEGGTSRVRPIDVTDPANPRVGTDLREFWGGGTILASSQRIIVGEPHGVDISSDGGKTWTFSRTGLESVTVSVNGLVQPIPNDELSRKFGIYALAVDPANPERIFAGTIRGLYMSRDGGQTWTRVSTIDEVQVNDLQFAESGAVLYVTTSDGVVTLSNP